MAAEEVVPVARARDDRTACRRRSAGDRGAALVEFAIVMPLLFLILFGIIEFGIAFNDYQSIRQGAAKAPGKRW